MIFNLSNETDRADYKRYCNEVYEWGCKKGGVVEVKKRHRQRSLSQNSYLHLILSYYASEFGYSLEEVKMDVFKRICNSDIFIRERENRRGSVVRFIRSTASLDTAEMTIAIKRCRNYSAMQAGLYIPSPDEHNAIAEAERQIARYMEYL